MSTVFVTGGTGLTGANVCRQLIERGDAVRALVRNPDEAAALAEIGVELVQADLVEADDVARAAEGCAAAIHCAALLGGASQDLDDFYAVNLTGTYLCTKHALRHMVEQRSGSIVTVASGKDDCAGSGRLLTSCNVPPVCATNPCGKCVE